MSRKTHGSLSWLSAITEADFACTGKAQILEDNAVNASETRLRGSGYHLVAEINVQNHLFGSSTASTLTLKGETSRDPNQRLAIDSLQFPPDYLRRVEYWDYAQTEISSQVLVVFSEPAKIVNDVSEKLVDAVSLIKSWTRLENENLLTQVIDDLTQTPRHAIAYVSGFELLSSHNSIPFHNLFSEFESLPDKPVGTVKGILDQLYIIANGIEDKAFLSLTQELLQGWQNETSPSAICGYLVWFDAYKQRIGTQDKDFQNALLEQVRRSLSMRFETEEQSDLWQQRVQQLSANFANL